MRCFSWPLTHVYFFGKGTYKGEVQCFSFLFYTSSQWPLAYHALRSQYTVCTEAKFLDKIQTKVLRVFLLAIHSHLESFALRFLFLQNTKIRDRRDSKRKPSHEFFLHSLITFLFYFQYFQEKRIKTFTWLSSHGSL
jgi:hypothetical protein